LPILIIYFYNAAERMNRSLICLKYVFSAQLCCFIIGLFCVSGVSQAASVYSEIDKASENYDVVEQLHSMAFDAYLKKNYQVAFQKWTEAAKKKHAKSQFNLALMHERGEVPNGQSSNAIALDLYKRSANGNYLPAYRYWAKMVEKDRPELAQRIRNVLRESAPKKQVSNTVTSEGSVEKNSAKQQESIADFLHREQWISQQADKNWTIQIVAYRDEIQLLEFADQHGLSEQEQGAYFMETAAGKTWYKLVLGSFVSKQEADQARNGLPASVRGEGPWLRQFKDVKVAINRSN